MHFHGTSEMPLWNLTHQTERMVLGLIDKIKRRYFTKDRSCGGDCHGREIIRGKTALRGGDLNLASCPFKKDESHLIEEQF